MCRQQLKNFTGLQLDLDVAVVGVISADKKKSMLNNP